MAENAKKSRSSAFFPLSDRSIFQAPFFSFFRKKTSGDNIVYYLSDYQKEQTAGFLLKTDGFAMSDTPAINANKNLYAFFVCLLHLSTDWLYYSETPQDVVVPLLFFALHPEHHEQP